MQVKKFNEMENLNEKSNNAKAISAGYNIGDIVYNIKMKKNLTIAPLDMPTQDYGDEYCSLSAVGANLDNYSKRDANQIYRTEFSMTPTAKKSYEKHIKINIDKLLKNKHYNKSDLLEYIENYINNEEL